MQAALMMLSQLLWISSRPGVYCRDNCLSWFEDTWLKQAALIRYVRMCVRDEVDCFSMQRGNNNGSKIDVGGEIESNRWRDRHV